MKRKEMINGAMTTAGLATAAVLVFWASTAEASPAVISSDAPQSVMLSSAADASVFVDSQTNSAQFVFSQSQRTQLNVRTETALPLRSAPLPRSKAMDD